MERIRHPQRLGDKLAQPDARDFSLVVLFEGWLEDLERLHSSAVAHLSGHDWELIAVDNPVDEAASEKLASLDRIEHFPLRDHVGWGAGRNLALRLATGRIVVVIDTSIELDGDVVDVLTNGFADESVGLIGRWGVVTEDGFHFTESSGPDADGVEAYFMAMRRRDLSRTGLFDPKFRWYRNADIDFSFQVRDAGLRTIVDPALPLTRHEHRLWSTTPEPEREDLSRKNFGRFRQHWGDRKDLFVRDRSDT